MQHFATQLPAKIGRPFGLTTAPVALFVFAQVMMSFYAHVSFSLREAVWLLCSLVLTIVAMIFEFYAVCTPEMIL